MHHTNCLPRSNLCRSELRYAWAAGVDDRRRKGDLFNMVLCNAGSTVNGGDGRRLCLEALFWLYRVFLVVFCLSAYWEMADTAAPVTRSVLFPGTRLCNSRILLNRSRIIIARGHSSGTDEDARPIAKQAGH